MLQYNIISLLPQKELLHQSRYYRLVSPLVLQQDQHTDHYNSSSTITALHAVSTTTLRCHHIGWASQAHPVEMGLEPAGEDKV